MNHMAPVTNSTKLELTKHLPPHGAQVDCGYSRSSVAADIPPFITCTGFFNFPLQEWDCACVATVLAECRKNCGCLFVFPVPVREIFPYHKHSLTEFVDELKTIHDVGSEPFFWSVHQYPGGGNECVRVFKELLMLEQQRTAPPETIDAVLASTKDAAINAINKARERN